MPDPAVHYAVSLLISTRVYNLRKSLLVALVGLLPDVDVVLGIHRSYTHTLLIPLLIAVAGAVAQIRGQAKVARFLYVSSVLYLTHLVLDMFTGLGPFLWPISNLGLFINVTVSATWTVLKGLKITPHVYVEAVPYVPKVSEVFRGTLCSNTSIIVLLSVVVILLIERWARRKD